MIVEDSLVVREFLVSIINNDPRLQVVAQAGNAEQAMKLIVKYRPQVVSMDIRLPGMNGFELTQLIMTEHPTPIVVVSSDIENSELKISMNALRAGALAVLQKPVGRRHADYKVLANELCTKLYLMSQVSVIRQRAIWRPSLRTLSDSTKYVRSNPLSLSGRHPQILALVASTGGPSSLVKLLNQLHSEFPVPIVIVQHISASFLNGFISWLDEVVKFKVEPLITGQRVEAGKVYVATSEGHAIFKERCIPGMDFGPAVSMQIPSGTVLLKSLAEVYGSAAIGVILTGMGNDGAEGLKALHDRGAFTIAEDASTAVVFGMPAAAVRLNAASEVLPLQDIAPRINQFFESEVKR